MQTLPQELIINILSSTEKKEYPFIKRTCKIFHYLLRIIYPDPFVKFMDPFKLFFCLSPELVSKNRVYREEYYQAIFAYAEHMKNFNEAIILLGTVITSERDRCLLQNRNITETYIEENKDKFNKYDWKLIYRSLSVETILRHPEWPTYKIFYDRDGYKKDFKYFNITEGSGFGNLCNYSIRNISKEHPLIDPKSQKPWQQKIIDFVNGNYKTNYFEEPVHKERCINVECIEGTLEEEKLVTIERDRRFLKYELLKISMILLTSENYNAREVNVMYKKNYEYNTIENIVDYITITTFSR